jgi:dTDP-glucose 4,6-dehydratase
MTILVTGGAGFIGSNFVIDWLEIYDELVINLDKLTYAGNLNNLLALKGNKNHVFVEGDIGNVDLVRELLQQYQPRIIANFAAETHVDRSIFKPETFVNTNIVGTFQLLDCTKEYWLKLSKNEKTAFCFLHVSTDEVFGSLAIGAPAFTENHRFEPNSPYSSSKASSDLLVRAYHHTYGLPVITTNCSNNYGPHQFPEKLIPLIINNALSHKNIPVYGDGLQIRDWLYVGDHCSALRAVLERGTYGETYNIGGNNQIANINTVNTLCDLLDELSPVSSVEGMKSYRELITYVKDRPGHDRRYAIDTTKIKTQLKWNPSETFESGIKKTVKWYLENSTWGEVVGSEEYHQ